MRNTAVLLALLLLLLGGRRLLDPARADEPAPEPPGEEAEADLPERFEQVTDRLYRSAQPLGDATFAAIAAQGIRVVVSVDGARPDLESARRHGLRYVHIPFGYDGVPRSDALSIAKLVRTLEGPFLFHCHHGRHRGPSGCAIALRVLEGSSREAAIDLLRESGTSPRYRGLWRDVAAFEVPTEEELAGVAAEWPEYVPPEGIVRGMVAVDQGFERMKAVREAGWKPPPAHPDVDPAHEALILAEAFREIARLPEVVSQPEDYRGWTAEAEQAAWDLSHALETEPLDVGAAARAYGRLAQSCKDCHAVYRDEAEAR